MSRSRLAVAVVAAAAAVSLQSNAAADCGGPDITVSRRTVAPGDTIVIEGHSWGDACNDTPGPVCNPPPLGEPIQDIRLQLRGRTSGDTVDLAMVDAGEDYLFETTVTVPDVPPGRYEIVDARGQGYFVGRALRVVRP